MSGDQEIQHLHLPSPSPEPPGSPDPSPDREPDSPPELDQTLHLPVTRSQRPRPARSAGHGRSAADMPPAADSQGAPDAQPGRRGQDRRAGRNRWVYTVATVVAGSGLAVALLLSGGQSRAPGSPGSTTSPSASVDEQTQQVQALDGVLRAREKAVETKDEAAWMATVDPKATAFRARQAASFEHLRAVPISRWHYDFAGVAPALSADRVAKVGPDAWVARVNLGYRVAGYDRADAVGEQYLTMVRRDGRWLVADDTDGGTVHEIWDLGPVSVVHGAHSIVLGTVPRSALRAYAREADAAVQRVTSIWGTRWPRRVVVLVPGTQAQMAELMQRDDSTGLEQVAAVTVGDISSGGSDTGPAGADRVLVNPAGMSRLGAVGRRVVVTHEMTHAAIRASTLRPVPVWLSEGMADYVGYQGVQLTRQEIAADVLALVRKGAGPTHLPTNEDFDPARTTIAPAYSSSWLACSLIADTYGVKKLVATYRQAAGGEALVPGAQAPAGAADLDPAVATDRAFRSVLGTSTQQFTVTWRAYLSRLAQQKAA